jgi:hypothetical protein
VLSILSRINHAKAEEADDYWKLQSALVETLSKNKWNGTYHKAKSEAHSPDAFRAVLMIACENDQGHDTGSDKTLKTDELLLTYFTQKIHTKSTAKHVVTATRKPRFFLNLDVSSLASVALVAQTGYSPPAPKPATPRATIIIQNKLCLVSRSHVD